MAKIMLVEDDNNLREIYEARLQAEGYTLVSAKDGEEALVLAKNEQPDLIISDVMMPKVSGFEMLDILRNTEGLKEVKVVMLTALGQSDDQKRADLLGADRYLVKSQVTLEDIVKVTHELLNDNPIAEPAPAAEQPAPVAVESMPMATPPAPVIDPLTEFVSTPVQETPFVDTEVAVAELPIVQTSEEELSSVAAEVENFVASSPTVPMTEPVTPVDTVSASDDKVMAEAIDNLVASTPGAPVTAAAEPVVATPILDPMMPQVITPTQAVDGNVPIANKKIISPLDTDPVAVRPDLNELLAIENAKELALAQAQTPETPAGEQEPAKPFDPNNIAL